MWHKNKKSTRVLLHKVLICTFSLRLRWSKHQIAVIYTIVAGFWFQPCGKREKIYAAASQMCSITSLAAGSVWNCGDILGFCEWDHGVAAQSSSSKTLGLTRPLALSRDFPQECGFLWPMAGQMELPTALSPLAVFLHNDLRRQQRNDSIKGSKRRKKWSLSWASACEQTIV